jgi:hypothetical protein
VPRRPRLEHFPVAAVDRPRLIEQFDWSHCGAAKGSPLTLGCAALKVPENLAARSLQPQRAKELFWDIKVMNDNQAELRKEIERLSQNIEEGERAILRKLDELNRISGPAI